MAVHVRLRRLLKNQLISLFHKHGYQVRPFSPFREEDSYGYAQTVKESQYYAVFDPPCPLFSPWIGHPDFKKYYEGVATLTLVSPDRCYMLANFARYATHLDGDFAECGVYKGGTALILSRVLCGSSNKKLFLFDSFKGLPPPDAENDKTFQQGQFSIDSVESVKQLLHDFGSMVVIRQGWIPETFAGLEQHRFAFVHLDVDLYQSNLDCLEFFYPRVVSGGVILFDEYGFPGARGEKDAVDAFLAGKPEQPIVLPTGQAFLVKLPHQAEN